MLELLGDVNGLRILDAGCGPGLYLSELAARGADIIGIDQSPDMVRLARERLGPLARVQQHDLDEPLPWAADPNIPTDLLELLLADPEPRVADDAAANPLLPRARMDHILAEASL
ncbi:methyltransferase domain-containing protein [Streptomyces xanthophaeus]|uniref:methyltransferase domain-containing protein n=1 Tax=Streptomyces xanthophaeus TaxID=67385 RepID=UPI0039886C70